MHGAKKFLNSLLLMLLLVDFGVAVAAECPPAGNTPASRAEWWKCIEANQKQNNSPAQTSEVAKGESPPDPKKEAAAESYRKDYINSCEKEKVAAEECCGLPERCLGRADGKDDANDSWSSIAVGAFQFGAATISNFPTSSIAAACGRMQNISHITAGLNGYLGMRCKYYVHKCRAACSEPAKEIERDVINECNQGRSQERSCVIMSNLLQKYAEAAKACTTFENQAARLASAALASELGAQFARMCKEQASAKPADTAIQDPFANADCTTAAAVSSPICQELCRRPGSESDPNCSGFFNGSGSGGETATSNRTQGLDNPFGLPPDEEEDPQLAQFGVTPPTPQSPRGGGAGGSGGMLGGGGASAGGSDNGGGIGEGPGYDTKIDRGLASGNGYTSAGGSLRSGSSGGYSGEPGSKAITSALKPFNLNDFLPGAGKTPTKLALRSPSALSPDISSAYGDIFKKVTDRFYQVCLRDALYDCSTLQKMKKQGN